MDSAPEDPFAALKGVAARLDVEIPNAANCLEGLRTSSATASATQVSEQATVREAELKLIELRLEKIVKEKSVSIQQLTECLKQTDRDNKETLKKLLPLGFKVPDHLLPAVENLVLQSYQATVREAADDTLEDSPCSLAKVVKKLEPAFSKVATSSSQCCKPSQVSSHLPKQLQLPGSTKTASQSQPRNFPVGSRLHIYVEEIGNDDTLTFMNHKASISRETAKPAVSSGMPDKDSAQSVHKEQEPSPGFPSLKQSLSNITFITGIQPLPRTPEVAGSQTRQEGQQETPKRKDWKFNKSVMATPKAPDCEETVMKFKEYKAAASKTPELRESPTPEQKENVGLRW